MADKPSTAQAADSDAASKQHSNNNKKKDAAAAEVMLRGSVLITNLPADMKEIYTHTLRRLVAPNIQSELGAVQVLEEVDGATLAVEVKGKAAAQQLYRRLQNAKIYGRRWKAQFMPRRATECGNEACLVDCRVVPAAPASLVERALSAVPGFLTLIRRPAQQEEEKEEGRQEKKKKQGKNDDDDDDNDETQARLRKKPRTETTRHAAHEDDNGGEGEEEEEEGEDEGSRAVEAMPGATLYDTDCETQYVASFVDEGSALHARAVLSGRLIGNSGVHLFLERRR